MIIFYDIFAILTILEYIPPLFEENILSNIEICAYQIDVC